MRISDQRQQWWFVTHTITLIPSAHHSLILYLIDPVQWYLMYYHYFSKVLLSTKLDIILSLLLMMVAEVPPKWSTLGQDFHLYIAIRPIKKNITLSSTRVPNFSSALIFFQFVSSSHRNSYLNVIYHDFIYVRLKNSLLLSSWDCANIRFDTFQLLKRPDEFLRLYFKFG